MMIVPYMMIFPSRPVKAQIAEGRASLIGGDLGDTILKWNSFVHATNGKLYGSPYRASTVLEVDPETDTVSTFGSLGSDLNKWYHMAEAPDGKIYSFPTNADTILEIDPDGQTATTYAGATSPVATTIKWPSTILGANGLLYGIPNRAQDVIEFNPDTKAVRLFGGYADNVGKWSKGMLADNGKIYGAPIGTETRMLEIDTTVSPATTTTHNLGLTGSANYNEAIYFQGKIYLIPLNATGIGIFDTSDNSFTTVGNFTDTSKWNHAVVANGKLYFIPRRVTYCLEFDPSDNSYVTFGNVGDPDKDLQWNKGVLAGNGKIYACPSYQTYTYLEIDPRARTVVEFGSVEPGVNFHWSNLEEGNGNVYGCPLDIDYVTKITINNITGLIDEEGFLQVDEDGYMET